MADYISIRGVHLHKLKNIDLDIPKNQLVMLTGLSGSGKSTQGFDILNKEGVRQYIKPLSK
jgi:excinuclease ABC subunit A